MTFCGVAGRCLSLAALLLVADAAQLRTGSHHRHHNHRQKQVPKLPGGPPLPAAVAAPAAAPAEATLAAGAPAPGLAVAAVAPASAPADVAVASAPAPATAAAAVLEPAVAVAAPAGMVPVVEAAAPTVVATQTEAPSVEDMQTSIDKMVEAEREVINQSDPLSQLKEELAATEWLEDQLAEKMTDMKEEVYRAKIVSAEQALSKETGSPGTAEMLGDMRLQMHALAAPFYNKVLEEEMDGLKERKHSLVEKIEDLEGNSTAEEAAAEREEKAELKKEAAEDAAEEAADKKAEKGSTDVTWQVTLVVLLVTLSAGVTFLAFGARRQRA